jgi:hypothetical protein
LGKLDVPVYYTGCSSFQPMQSIEICYTEPSSAKSDVPKLEIGGSRICRSSDNLSEIAAGEPNDWRTPLVRYLENAGLIADRKVWQ